MFLQFFIILFGDIIEGLLFFSIMRGKGHPSSEEDCK